MAATRSALAFESGTELAGSGPERKSIAVRPDPMTARHTSRTALAPPFASGLIVPHIRPRSIPGRGAAAINRLAAAWRLSPAPLTRRAAAARRRAGGILLTVAAPEGRPGVGT